jgi:hypothetical protein
LQHACAKGIIERLTVPQVGLSRHVAYPWPVPTSHSNPISTILALVESLRPNSVLGVGFGKYGFLMREDLDVRREDYGCSDWRHRIEGVIELLARFR